MDKRTTQDSLRRIAADVERAPTPAPPSPPDVVEAVLAALPSLVDTILAAIPALSAEDVLRVRAALPRVAGAWSGRVGRKVRRYSGGDNAAEVWEGNDVRGGRWTAYVHPPVGVFSFLGAYPTAAEARAACDARLTEMGVLLVGGPAQTQEDP